MADIKFETKLDFGKINDKSNKRLTYTSWNDGEFKFDIRDWYENGNVGKGITLTKTELKALYDLLIAMYEAPEQTEEETVDDGFDDLLKEFAPKEPEYPDTILKAFAKLDEVFKGFKVEKAYGKMPIAEGDRLQYKVIKGKKKLPDYADVLVEFDLKSFLTDKGNLFIYTL